MKNKYHTRLAVFGSVNPSPISEVDKVPIVPNN